MSEKCFIPTISRMEMLLSVGLLLQLSSFDRAAQAEERHAFHFRFDTDTVTQDDRIQAHGVQLSALSPGDLTATVPLSNDASWQFDGRSAIAYVAPGNADGFAENFTWEGFFLSPATNTFLPETGIADRLLTQFAFDKGDWTRLAIGLVADGDGSPRLCVELEGFEGRSFGMGDRTVLADRWHHFALVHEGTAAAARIRWYLDYRLTGELFLGGQSNQNTLRPPGRAPFTIGARLRTGDSVNRGFHGFIDEIRMTPRPLIVDRFLHADKAIFEETVNTAQMDGQQREAFWKDRHRWAREQVRRWSGDRTGSWSIDDFFDASVQPVDDAAFLRRLSLTVRGRIPTLEEVIAFTADDSPGKRVSMIDRLLGSTEWGDGWVGYWQDVLAENPSVVFPTLNNSGAFRQWIYESFRDNKPFDRFATELILMENHSTVEPDDDGPAGFALATGNDVPMAMRSHVALKAFAAVDLTCARCHDSPVDDFLQADLFRLAAYLNGGPLEVPESSVSAVGKMLQHGVITTSLVAGQIIQPKGLSSHWLSEHEEATSLNPIQPGPRGELAALITSPRNGRFSDVIVNRVWQRYFGTGLVEPVDQWNEGPAATHPELFRHLSAEFVDSGYNVKALARRILSSGTWQQQRQHRERMTAEQLIDSLFVAVGKDFQAETLGVHATDPGAVQLPQPHRAWQFAALPNERDRPALGMPVSQTIVDVMAAFGWNGSRQQPRSKPEQTTSALQPLMLFNGLVSQRITRLSEQSAITALCLQDISPAVLTDRLFLTVLGRPPDEEERQRFTALFRPGFKHRRTGIPARPFEPLSTFQPDWRKHLEAEQTRLMLRAQQRVARGEPPTTRLTDDFRERVEDVLWALINSPEFVVIP
ncbi:MAG TPA: DUF1553 domain-containing protein [Planctomycetes bacterium]|nr:DUF1553 domain-containing protein [Fuerstiella sp.]HIK94620.1 DUF1553 domain-containing protein [Planctomycetota bacterium]